MRPYAYVDLDGTIIDSMPRHYTVFMEALKYYKLNSMCTYDTFYSLKRIGLSTKSICERVGYDQIDAEKISKYWVEHIEDDKEIKKDKFFDDASAFLSVVSEKYQIIVLSARKNNLVIDQIEQSSFQKYITEILIVNPMNALTEKINCIIERGYNKAIIVGDTENEYNISQNLNVKLYLLNRGFRSKSFWNSRCVTNYSDLNEVKDAIMKETGNFFSCK